MADPSNPSSPSDPSGSVADSQIPSDPNIIPPPESASSPTDRPVSTILADSPIEPKTPLADPATDYTIPSTVPDESTVATESASIASSPSAVPADVSTEASTKVYSETTVPAESPSQSATVPTETQGEASPPPSPPIPEEIPATQSPFSPQATHTPSPESVVGGSIEDSLPPDQPSQVQPEAPESASSPQASQEPEKAPQSAGIKPEPPQGTQLAPLADPNSQKSSFGDLISDQPKPVSPPVSPQLSQSPQAPISSISPQPPTEKVVVAKADFSSKRQQALQTRRKKRDDHLAKILTLIGQKGKAHNKDVRDLLRVSQSTASDYLQTLVKNGKIKREGKAKATVYTF